MNSPLFGFRLYNLQATPTMFASCILFSSDNLMLSPLILHLLQGIQSQPVLSWQQKKSNQPQSQKQQNITSIAKFYLCIEQSSIRNYHQSYLFAHAPSIGITLNGSDQSFHDQNHKSIKELSLHSAIVHYLSLFFIQSYLFMNRVGSAIDY